MQFEIIENGGALLVAAPGNDPKTLSAACLWAACPSAQGRVRRLQKTGMVAPRHIRIQSVAAIGLYGINIAFSDGHARGIYPWTYLATLTEARRLEDFLIDEW